MSVQFGRWNLGSQQIPHDYMNKIDGILARYAPDGGNLYSQDGIIISYHAFHTTKESRREMQPHVCSSGTVLTWDGRLDNRSDLIRELAGTLSIDSTDVAIVAAAYDNWGTKCFAKLIGDWTLSLWDPSNRFLLLAKDPIGPRQLYYSIEKNQITWSTILDPLVLLAGKRFSLCEEYIAGWLSQYPATHLTPYAGIQAVPPSSLVLIQPAKHTVTRYWDFDPGKTIRYVTDSDYEEHFRNVFATAVERRLRCDTTILGELSGGRDSCSIVCMADIILAKTGGEVPRLDTVSYYDDSEPHWNERPYFTKVEEQRHRKGLHINISPDQESQRDSNFSSNGHVLLAPGYTMPFPEFGAYLISHGNRVVLSGIGGDEVMGGVPTPIPELQDLVARVRLGTLAHQLKAWALQKRKPWLHLVLEAVRGFFPPAIVGVAEHVRPVSWLHSKFVKRHWAALTGYQARVKLLGPLPSFQDNVSTLENLRRQLACRGLPFEPSYEKRYPFLDRDLLEFMFAIPREQSVRPTQRRSLMRRALAGIVPSEVLNRKGKAPAMRGPILQLRQEWANLGFMSGDIASGELGIVHTDRFFAALKKIMQGEEFPIMPILRITSFEDWIRKIGASNIIDLDTTKGVKLALEATMQA